MYIKKILKNNENWIKTQLELNPDYFENPSQKILFEEIINFVQQYNKQTTKEILCIEVEKRNDLPPCFWERRGFENGENIGEFSHR